MGNAVSNTGRFEPPGSKALAAFTAEHTLQTDPRWIALKAAETELKARRAEDPVIKVKGPPKPRPKCSICKSHVDKAVNPWQQTKIDLLALEMSDNDSDVESDTDGKPEDDGGIMVVGRKRTGIQRRGIELNPCLHVFCGACLAQYIYNNLHIPFDPSAYGTKLGPVPESKLDAKTQFPMGCPTCQVKPGEKLVEISDLTARLVLGEGNMEGWNHARLVSKMNIIYCPYKDCNEPFDINNIIVPPVRRLSKTPNDGVQCPSCHRNVCKDCKVKWHDKLTCADYQALPAHERAPEDVALMALAKKKKWRRCPKCNAMVERTWGCSHITCSCGHHFCYRCGADFETENGNYRCSKNCRL